MNNCENCIEGRPRIGRLAGVTRTMRLAIFEGEGVPTGTPQDLMAQTVVVRVLLDGTNDIYVPDFVVEGTGNNVIKFVWPANRQAVGNYTLDVTMTDGSDNVNRVNWHGKDGIRLVQYSNQVYGEDATGQESSEAVGLVGYFTTNGVGMSAFDEWRGSEYSEGYPQTVAGFMAYLKQPATDAANAARQQMQQIQSRADEDHTRAGNDHSTAESDHTRAEGDHTTAASDHATAAADHSTAAADHTQAGNDHTRAEGDHTTAASDHTLAAADHTQAASDHSAAASDHTRAGQDHTRSGSDHEIAVADHAQAEADHTRAESDHGTAAADHTQAGADHSTAAADHTLAASDHSTAAEDHTQAVADHAVMAGYDTRLTNVETDVTQLGKEVGGYLAKETVSVDTPTYTQGAMKTDGTVDASSTTYGYVAPILLKQLATIVLNQGSAFYRGGNVACVYQCDSSGVFLKNLVAGPNYQTLVTDYTNASGQDIYVGISGYKTQLKYNIIKPVEAAPKTSLDEIDERTAILEAGVDEEPIIGSEKLVKSGGVATQLAGKVGYQIVDATETENLIEGSYVKYADGKAVEGGPTYGWTIRGYDCRNVSKIYCEVDAGDSVPAAIAFYSAILEQPDHTVYMKGVSIQMVSGQKTYEVFVPQGAQTVFITNAASYLSTPVVRLYYNQELIEKIASYDSQVLFQSNFSNATTTITSYFIVEGVVPNGTQLEIEITERSGDGSILLRTVARSNVESTNYNYAQYISQPGKYYVEKVDGMRGISLEQKAIGGAQHKFNWILRALSRRFPIMNRAFAPFLPAKPVTTIDLGTPFQGYYSVALDVDSENTIVNSSSWVSFPLQKTNGFIIQVSFDSSIYVLNYGRFSEDYRLRDETLYDTSPVLINLCNGRGWNLAVRRKNYASLTPADAAGVLTVTRVSGTIYEKPLLKYEAEKIVDAKLAELGDISAISSVANKALSIAKEGYGWNPFIEKPFYYHFKANGFIRNGAGLKTIASQSLDDVELAARLGFGLIEANIQATSDGHFVVIHGTSGKFGPECKSINTSIITTEELQNTYINSVTLSWIKENVRYDSDVAKYQTALPSLEEFCEACKTHRIGIFAGTSNQTAVEICVKYLGQNVAIYNSPVGIRNYYNGWCFIWNNTTSTTVSEILSACRSKGAPVMYGLGPDLAAKLYTDDNLNTLIESMHEEGFLIGWTANYDSESNGRKYLKLGMDFSSSENDINSFDANYEIFDIDSENQPTVSGAISDGIITLADGETITCGAATKIIGKGWLTIRFSGTLQINFGSQGSTGRTITSDGSEDIIISDYYFNKSTALTITSTGDTTVTKFMYKTSKC